MHNTHTFHIPVLGIGFTIDTPLKVAPYGISSVVSLVDDELVEALRRHYCAERNEPYTPISTEAEDARARRLTAYLNLLNTMVQERTDALRRETFAPGAAINRYFELLPDSSALRERYDAMLACTDDTERASMQQELRDAIRPGAIDVNIMVKVDRDRFRNGEKQAPEYGDAMAALRGFANSDLESSIVLSAGFNRRLTRYVENFADFHADALGRFRKRIVLKVSDFRSAITQARMFARGGLWISEYRIESGLNCGGHTFDGDGSLIGPILEEFKTRREELYRDTYATYAAAAEKAGRNVAVDPAVRITVQGGVGTAAEHQFLLNRYEVDAVGWGSPFLLVPECVNVDPDTLAKLAAAGEDQIVSSDVSPLGVRFSNLVNSGAELHKHELARAGKPGSNCPKGYLKFNTEFGEKPLCVASRTYQRKKLAELERVAQEQQLEAAERERCYLGIVDRTCLCRDLSGSVEINYGIGLMGKDATPAVCPGPNLAFFSKVSSLQQMVDHIYGRINLMVRSDRPHMFVNELKLCVASLSREVVETVRERGYKSAADLRGYRDRLLEGIEYYRDLMGDLGDQYTEWKKRIPAEIAALKQQIEQLAVTYPLLAAE